MQVEWTEMYDTTNQCLEIIGWIKNKYHNQNFTVAKISENGETTVFIYLRCGTELIHVGGVVISQSMTSEQLVSIINQQKQLIDDFAKDLNPLDTWDVIRSQFPFVELDPAPVAEPAVVELVEN